MTLLEELNVYFTKKNAIYVDASYIRHLLNEILGNPTGIRFSERYAIKCILGFLADKIKEEENINKDRNINLIEALLECKCGKCHYDPKPSYTMIFCTSVKDKFHQLEEEK